MGKANYSFSFLCLVDMQRTGCASEFSNFVLSLRPAMESSGLVWFYFLNRVQIPLYCVTTSDKPHPKLPSSTALGCVSAGNPNPKPSLEGGRPPVYPVNSSWAPAVPGCDFSGMQSRLHFPIQLDHPHICHGVRTQLRAQLPSEEAEVVSMWQWRFQLLLRGSGAAPWIQQCLNSTTQQTLPALPHTEVAA